MDDLEENPLFSVFHPNMAVSHWIWSIDKTMDFQPVQQTAVENNSFRSFEKTLKNQDTAGVFIPGAWDARSEVFPSPLVNHL